MRLPVLAAPALALLGAIPAAHADTWLSAEVPAAMALSSPQSDRFTAGAMPALGVYQDLLPYLAVALRLRGGALGDGDAPAGGLMDPGLGGLAIGGAAVRLHGDGPWLEALVGGGMTGDDAVPAVEAGLGWQFDLGAVSVGPSLRVLHVFSSDDGLNPGSADLVLVGVELTAGRSRRPAPIHITGDYDRVTDRDLRCPLEGGSGCPSPIVDRDGDGILDENDACIDQPETVNGVDDHDGCPDEGLFVVENDRIVLEERVLFELNRARVRKSGRVVIEAIAGAWQIHPEWEHMTIEGHADIRGPDDFNKWLSDTRAARVREALVEAGMPAERIDSIGYSNTRPRDPGNTEAAYQRNRRVEFVITRGGSRQAPTQTLPTTPADGAPAADSPPSNTPPVTADSAAGAAGGNQ